MKCENRKSGRISTAFLLTKTFFECIIDTVFIYKSLGYMMKKLSK